MTESSPKTGKPSLAMILVPALISLAVTLWRLTGELMTWSRSWFNPEAGGMNAIVGITWLAPVFGAYFALKLVRQGYPPPGRRKAVLLGLLGLGVLFVGASFQATVLAREFRAGLIYIWLVGAAAAAIQYRAWPALFRVLLYYGLAARIPVVVIMFLAMWGGWGTHYDAVPAGFPSMGWFSGFLWLGLFPQLIFWIGFTIVTGLLMGSIAVGLVSWRNPLPA